MQFTKVSYAVCIQYFAEDFEDNSFCLKMVEKELAEAQKDFTFLTMIELLPVASFLILHYPHDCYKCLGKDPDRNFSQYQFTERELATRQMRVKYGAEAEEDLSTRLSPKEFNR